MKQLLITTILLIALQQSVSAVQCYYCIASLQSDCAKGDTSAMISIRCGAPRDNRNVLTNRIDQEDTSKTNDPEGFAATCVTFHEPLPGGATAFVRGCAVLPSNVDACKYIDRVIHGTDCVACNTTLCNK